MSNDPISIRASLSLALIGSGGAGVMTAGQVILDTAARCGLYGLMNRSSGPQIRGGEAAAIVRLDRDPVACQDDRLDWLVALDFNQAERFADELILDQDSLVFADPDAGEIPAWITESQARVVSVPFAELVARQRGVRINAIAIGLVAGLAGLDGEQARRTLTRLFQKRGSRLVEAAIAGHDLGFQAAGKLPVTGPSLDPRADTRMWLMTGNEACALGAIHAGVRFSAAYPITPSTEIQEWLATNLPAVGGHLIQAEDELASINMCIGASLGGVPALTATSGPGFSLMVEALGLAIAAEVPLTVVNVMRGGPSTGIPTRPEQADLNIAVYGSHGDAPRLVLAPNSIADCIYTTHKAVCWSEALQCPAVVLSDQFLGQARAAIEAPRLELEPAKRRLAAAGQPDYQRFVLSDDGVSAMGIPGIAGATHTASGLTHQTSGRPSSLAADHHAQLDKRRRKLETFDFGSAWADIEGDGPLALVTFGSITGACREAIARLQARAPGIRLISLRLLAPLNRKGFAAALEGIEQLLVVEQNHGAQLYHYLRSQIDLPSATSSFARPGPLSLKPGQIETAIRKLTMEQAA